MHLKLITTILLCALFLAGAAAAETITLNAQTQPQYQNGLNYTGTGELLLVLEGDTVITNTHGSGIESAAPLTIQGTGTLTVTGTENGITAPSITIKSGTINARAGVDNGSVSCGLNANTGNITILGGTVYALAESTSHKNKGLYAEQNVIIQDGLVTASANGTVNCFAIDGFSADKNGGVFISGGTVIASATNGLSRNIGIDSKYGNVTISKNPVLAIHIDTCGGQNFALNRDILKVDSGDVVVFESNDDGNYRLMHSANLTRDFTLISGKIFEVSGGKCLTVAKGVKLTTDGAELIHSDKSVVIQTPAPVIGLLAGLGAAFVLFRRMRKYYRRFIKNRDMENQIIRGRIKTPAFKRDE
ncbi:MAG: carbohydrate-binding domain-containing protein [Methanocorpusculum sp.]|nr:carbohydrate-binding domain-containing protein [Methanocorpusculum sp.]